MFSRPAVFMLILLCLSSVVNAQMALRIIGGKTANTKTWPWMAALVYKYSPDNQRVFCGASLIAKDWVLTAGHCVIAENKTSVEVIINPSILDDRQIKRFAIERIILHPQYDDLLLKNDLALIKLTESSPNTPIKILSPYSDQDNSEKRGIALGWGSISVYEELLSSTLQQVELPIIDNLLCASRMIGLTDNMLCAGDALGNKDTCQGDSGGPLMVFNSDSQHWQQAGITSWGYGCAQKGAYGVYTRLKNYAQFISNTICTANNKPSPTTLSLITTGHRVTASWKNTDDVAGYDLNYAPYPDAQPIYSMDMNQLTELSVELDANSAFYVAITRYVDNCLSNYSNIAHFTLN